MSKASGVQKLTGLFSPKQITGAVGLGKKDSPAPQPVPIAPTEDPNAAAARDAEARRAQTDREATGRRSTIAAGLSIEEEDQQSRGLFKAKPRKAASSAILG